MMEGKGLLVAHRNRARAKLVGNLDVIRGSLVETYRTCGKPGCRCREGAKHGPYYLLTWSEDGKARSAHVPRDRVRRVKQMIRDYQEAREALLRLGEINRRLVLEHGSTEGEGDDARA